MPFHAIAVLSGGRQKTIPNRTEDRLLSEVVLPFVANGVITAKWGKKDQSYQALELRIYESSDRWDKRNGPLADLIKKKRNQWKRFSDKAERLLAKNKFRVFVITPIQGEQHGSQNQQRIYKEYDDRFKAIEALLAEFDGVAIRIDKEHPLESLVTRIKREIREASFVIADLTDERPSCYFEVGFADGLSKHVIYVASKESVTNPGTQTRIHFDIHANVHFFTNTRELQANLRAALKKNSAYLFDKAKLQEPADFSP